MENSNKTKTKILKVATKLFAQNGYKGTSMSDIALTVNIEKSSLYYFYKNKNDIFFEVINQLTAELINDIKKINQTTTNKKTKLQQIINTIIKSGLKSGLTIIDINSSELSKNNNCQKVFQHFNEIKHNLIILLKQINIKQPQIAQQVILNAIHAYVIHAQKHKQVSQPNIYATYLTRLFI